MAFSRLLLLLLSTNHYLARVIDRKSSEEKTELTSETPPTALENLRLGLPNSAKTSDSDQNSSPTEMTSQFLESEDVGLVTKQIVLRMSPSSFGQLEVISASGQPTIQSSEGSTDDTEDGGQEVPPTRIHRSVKKAILLRKLRKDI